MKIVYLDNNATTQLAPEVLEAMLPYLKDQYGNPSSLHLLGNQAHEAVEKARSQVACSIGVHPTDIVFTSGGTESNNLAIMGTLEARPSKRHIITTAVEHPSIRTLIEWLEEKKAYQVTRIGVDRDGILDLDELKGAIRQDTALVSSMWANNETGVLMPVREIAKITRERGILFHCDAVQALGKVKVDLTKIPIDLLSLSGHKVHAPKGVGVLYVRRGVRIRPHLIGGHQESGRRGGTENVASIVGFAKACMLAKENLSCEETHVRMLRGQLEEGILETIPDAQIISSKAPRVPNTVCVTFSRVEGESVLLYLSELGVCASSGTACTTGSLEPSPVLLAMGYTADQALGSARFSLSRYTSADDIGETLRILPDVVSRLRALSPSEREEVLGRVLTQSA
jgi:cysteine desulfurase